MSEVAVVLDEDVSASAAVVECLPELAEMPSAARVAFGAAEFRLRLRLRLPVDAAGSGQKMQQRQRLESSLRWIQRVAASPALQEYPALAAAAAAAVALQWCVSFPQTCAVAVAPVAAAAAS